MKSTIILVCFWVLLITGNFAHPPWYYHHQPFHHSPIARPRLLTQCSRNECGGFAGIACCPGLRCDRANTPCCDQFSQCVPIRNLISTPRQCSRTQCGGLANIQCCPEFVCDTRGATPFSDQLSACVRITNNDTPNPRQCSSTRCGGIAGIVCCPGFHCDDDNTPCCDQFSRCVPQISRNNSTVREGNINCVQYCSRTKCGGYEGFQCCPGLRCNDQDTPCCDRVSDCVPLPVF